MFAQTTHVVAAPRGFACVVILATRLYIPTFIEIRSGVSESQGVKIWPFPITLASRFYNSLYYRTSRDILYSSATYTVAIVAPTTVPVILLINRQISPFL